MKPTLFALVTALALGALAGCNRNQDSAATPATPPSSQTGSAASGSSAPQSSTPTTPANIGTPNQAEKQPPVQGREDVRQPEQQKDFQHKGDAAGPKQ